MSGGHKASIFVLVIFIFNFCAAVRNPYEYQPQANNPHLQTKDHWIIDKNGRVRLFHGFNAVQKGPPWYPLVKMEDKKLDFYRDWGFTAVRLGMMWSGVYPEEGVLNVTYINIMKDIVKRAGERGIFVLFDMHQDVISSKYHAYDGVPMWVIDKCPPPKHPYPWPLQKIFRWDEGYLTEAVGNAFQCIYNNENHTLDYMAQFWTTVAKTFKDFDNILGYELMNEPWAGNIYKDATLLLPANADSKNLAPMYDKLNSAIRTIDNNTLLFYEPVTWGMVFPGTSVIGSGFKSVPGGSAYESKSVFSWHYYCPLLKTDDRGRYIGLIRVACDDVIGPLVFKTVLKDILRTGGSAFLTEFGTCKTDGHLNDTETIECNFVMEQADKNLQSWTYWDSEFFDNATDKINLQVAKGFARTYASAIAGEPRKMDFDPQTRKFYLLYKLNISIRAPTEIKVPKLQYPNGFSVQVSPFLKSEFDEQTRTLYVTTSGGGHAENALNDMGVVTIGPI